MEASLTDSLETTATISVRDLRVNYGEHEILHGISFDVNRGETLVILGGSGSGKSTLLRTQLRADLDQRPGYRRDLGFRDGRHS